MSFQQQPLFLGAILQAIKNLGPKLAPLIGVGVKGGALPIKVAPKIALPAVSTGTKVLTAGAITGLTLSTALITQTPEALTTISQVSKDLADVGKSFSQVGQNVTEFLTDNPIILPIALGIGLIVVLKS